MALGEVGFFSLYSSMMKQGLSLIFMDQVRLS